MATKLRRRFRDFKPVLHRSAFARFKQNISGIENLNLTTEPNLFFLHMHFQVFLTKRLAYIFITIKWQYKILD